MYYTFDLINNFNIFNNINFSYNILIFILFSLFLAISFDIAYGELPTKIHPVVPVSYTHLDVYKRQVYGE